MEYLFEAVNQARPPRLIADQHVSGHGVDVIAVAHRLRVGQELELFLGA